MQKCGELHGDDCPAALRKDWLCCPLCGRKTAALSLETVHFNADTQNAKNFPLKLRLEGHCPLHGRLEFDADSILKSENPGFALDEAQPVINVLLTVPALAKMTSANVYVCARNGRRDRNPDDPWNPNGILDRRQHTLHFSPQQKGRVEPDETLVIFRPSTQERTIRLRNTGQEAVPVRIPLLPTGYLIKPEAPQFTIPKQDEYVLTVTGNPLSPAGAQEELLFEWGGEISRTLLCREAPRRASGYKPRYIVGLDFGTRNTSAILRDTTIKNPAEATFFIPDGSPREPTFMYYSQSESKLVLGERAQDYMMERGEGDGFFIDRLKEYLISEEEPFVEKARRLNLPKPERFEVDKLLTLYLKNWKEDMDASIEARSGDAIPETHYVFSYPVLDKGEMRRRHLDRMKAALRKVGFPVDSERDCSFVEEPVSAALYFLIGKARSAKLNAAVERMLSRASLAAGIPLLVIDSGGGTTDVVFGTVKVTNGEPEFTIENTLGLDSAARRFGGVDVTNEMYDALRGENIPSVVENVLGRPVSHDEVKYNFVEPTKIYFNSTSSVPAPAITPQNFSAVLDNGRAVAKNLKQNLGTLIEQIAQRNLTFKIPELLSDTVVAPRWNALEQAMRREIFATRDPKDVYVILVGGNTHLRALGERCAEMFSESKIIDLSALLNYNLPPMGEDDKMLAVAGGTVWYYGARINNLTPYETELSLRKHYASGEPMQESLMKREGGKVTAGTPYAPLRDLSDAQKADILITAKYEGAEGQVVRIPLPETIFSESTQFYITYTPARIQVQGPDRQLLGEYLF